MKSLWDLIAEKNQLKGIRQELTMALSTTEGSALSPQSLEPKIVELVRKLSPLIRGLKVILANGKTHEYNERNALPSAYFEGEKATTPTSQSNYDRKATPLKIIRAKGGVTGFQQAASKKFINSYVQEIVGASQAFAWQMEYGAMWASSADPYQFDGLDAKISANRSDINAIITLRHLDAMIDAIINVGIVDFGDLAIYLSPFMHSKISSLQTEVRIPITKVKYPGGIEMESYRNIPMIDTSFCRPTSTMGVVTAADDATPGGLIDTKTYRFRVAAVTQFGEQWASPEVAHTLGGTGKTSVKLSFTAVAGALLYKVYRTLDGGAAGTQQFASAHAANTYDGSGTVIGVVAFVIDTIADAALTNYTYLLNTNVDEVLFLLNRNADISVEVASLLNEQGEKVENLIQMLPLARTKDQEEFLLLSYLALIYKGDIFNGMLRKIRTA